MSDENASWVLAEASEDLTIRCRNLHFKLADSAVPHLGEEVPAPQEWRALAAGYRALADHVERLANDMAAKDARRP